MSATTTNQSVSGNLLCGQNDTLNCYTPYIKYTKLEFEVTLSFLSSKLLEISWHL